MVAVMIANPGFPVAAVVWIAALLVLAGGLGGFIAWADSKKRQIAVAVIVAFLIALVLTQKAFADGGVDIPAWLICWPWC